MDIASTILKHGPERLKAASGIPVRTLYRWAKDNKIPGKGYSHDLRLNQLKEAVEKIEADAKPARKSKQRRAQ